MSWENRNLFNRRFNLGLNQEDAYVSGYFGGQFLFSSNVTDHIVASANMNSTNRTWENSSMGNMLSSLCEGVTTVPGGTLNVAIMTAMGGAKWGAPTNVDFGDQMTMKFRELSKFPVKKLITAWTNLIRHSNTGASLLHANSGGDLDSAYTKKMFSADYLYWTLKPNARDVEFACMFSGIYAMSDLSSQIATELATVDGQTFDVNFHVDALNWDKVVLEKAQNAVDEFHANGVAPYYTRTPSGTIG